jgi:uptake hydrogenase large subunit
MNPGGDLKVRLAMRSRQIASVDIASSRAGLPSSFLHGRRIDEVEQIVPTLFSICRSAQAAAASGALEAATGVTRANGSLQQRCASVSRETVVEMLTRLLIDWPRVMQAEPDVVAVARVRRSREDEILDACREVACTRVFGVDGGQWLDAMCLDGLLRWLARGKTLPARLLARLQTESPDLGCSVVRSMPDATLDALNDAILPRLTADASLALRPDWLGTPAETGSIARVGTHPLVAEFIDSYGNSAAARYLARMVELALLLAGNDDTRWLPAAARQHTLGDGLGVGVAETARGLLLHLARVDDGRVTGYTIVAPTEWNFHPQGALTQGLVGRRVADAERAMRDARVLVQALDPCVACDIEVIEIEVANA